MQARNNISRRQVLKLAGAASVLATAGGIRSAWAQAVKRIEQLDPGLDRILSDIREESEARAPEVNTPRTDGCTG